MGCLSYRAPMTNQPKIDRLLAEVRNANDILARGEAVIAAERARLKKHEALRAEMLGRIAFLEGKPKSRNPLIGDMKRFWNIGWNDEHKAR